MFARLQRLYDRLTEALDRALEKLDEITKSLLRRYYRALEYLEKLYLLLRKLARVIFPIIILFVPPLIGFVIAFLIFKIRVSDSIVLGVMSAVLLLILLASFRSKPESPTAEAGAPRASLTIASELDSFSTERKLFGAIIALIILMTSLYLHVGFFLGLLIFIAEVIVLYVLKWLYGTGENQDAPITQ